MSLIFHSRTASQLAAIAQNMPHALLLTGEVGVGLRTAARHLAGASLSEIIEPLDKDGAPNHKKGTISVARIRDLYSDTRGKSTSLRTFIIDDADMMSLGAQNAFLKLLEEPAQNVGFILTSHHPEALLPTIMSRIEQLAILPLTEEQSKDMAIHLGLRGQAATRALFVATGLPAELARLSGDSAYFDAQVAIMSAAKAYVSGAKKDAIAAAYEYAASRELAMALLLASKKLLQFSLRTTPSREAMQQLQRYNSAYDAIAANGNTKLQLIAAMV